MAFGRNTRTALGVHDQRNLGKERLHHHGVGDHANIGAKSDKGNALNILFIFQTLDFQCADEYQFLQGVILNEVKYLGRRFFADAQNDNDQYHIAGSAPIFRTRVPPAVMSLCSIYPFA